MTSSETEATIVCDFKDDSLYAEATVFNDDIDSEKNFVDDIDSFSDFCPSEVDTTAYMQIYSAIQANQLCTITQIVESISGKKVTLTQHFSEAGEQRNHLFEQKHSDVIEKYQAPIIKE